LRACHNDSAIPFPFGTGQIIKNIDTHSLLPIEFLIFVNSSERSLKFMKNPGINKKILSFFVVFLIYALAFLAGFLVYAVLKYTINILLITFIADVAATLIVWGAGLIFKNSSVYDPYWSVVPAVVVPFWIIIKKAELSAAVILMIAVLVVWAARLTLNWALRWKGLKHEDWRYLMLKEKSPRTWFLTNLVGINLMPTAIVFIVLIPVYYCIGFAGRINYLTIIGFIVSASSVIVQTISDAQMDLFRKSGFGIIDKGLWRHSRHPNYFGEVMFWWGLWIMQMGINPQKWITVAGPVVMTLLFVFISIPMMEKHIIESKPDYLMYQKQVSMLIPWFRVKASKSKGM
jgi:steroid 5-alpha reductase family enzyme